MKKNKNNRIYLLTFFTLYLVIFHFVVLYIILPKSIFYPPKEITFDEFVKNRDRYKGNDIIINGYISVFFKDIYVIKNESVENDLDYFYQENGYIEFQKKVIPINFQIVNEITKEYNHPSFQIIVDSSKDKKNTNDKKTCINEYVKIYGWVGRTAKSHLRGLRNIYKIEVYEDKNFDKILFTCYEQKNYYIKTDDKEIY